MEKIIDMIPRWGIRVNETDVIRLDIWELTALQLWLLMAINTESPRPLWLDGRKYVISKNGIISFDDVYSTLNRAQAVNIINTTHELTKDEATGIYMLGIHYPASDSWQSDFNTVDLKETMAGSFIGFWREDTRESILPVKLCWSEDLGVWYGVKGKPNGGVSFNFKDLSIGQI